MKPGTLNCCRPGPTARTSTVRAEPPPITNPAASEAPAPICLKTETLMSRGVVAEYAFNGVAS